jgi:tetratricopeptide (TPR) repeat protein
LAKIVYPIILLLHLTTLVLTASRGALLALILGLLICLCAAFFLRPKGYTGKNKKFQIISITIILLVLISASLYAARDSLSELGIFKRTEATVETINKGKIPDRLSFLYSALAMFVDHPITGTGLSTFRDAYSAYRRADYYIDGPGNAQFITVPEAAHDEYANVLATQGVIGFLAYLLLIGAAFRILIINIRKVEDLPSDFSRNYYLALLGGLSAYLIQTIFNFGEINNLFLFYLLLGLIFSTDTIFQISFSIRGMAAKTAEIIFIFVMLVLLAFVFNYGVINEGQADFYLKNAKQDDLNRNYTQAEKDYQLAIAARPQEYSIYQLYGDFLLSISAPSSDTIMLQRAIDNYQEVIRLNNNYPSTYHNLGLAYLQMYRLTKKPLYGELAKKAYQLSVDKAPNNPRYPYEYARILHSDFNDPAAAIALLKQAIAIDPDYQEPHDYLDFIYKNYPALR